MKTIYLIFAISFNGGTQTLGPFTQNQCDNLKAALLADTSPRGIRFPLLICADAGYAR